MKALLIILLLSAAACTTQTIESEINPDWNTPDRIAQADIIDISFSPDVIEIIADHVDPADVDGFTVRHRTSEVWTPGPANVDGQFQINYTSGLADYETMEIQIRVHSKAKESTRWTTIYNSNP
jgi:hypothetical protein